MKKIGIIFLLFFLTGCGSYQTGKIPEIRYGQDLCSECRMTLMDAQFACVILTEEEEILKFDDIGCMVRFQKSNQTKIKEAWVHDGMTQAWVQSSKAYFVFDQTLNTPMGSHLMALSSKESLQECLKKNGAKQISFDQINELLKEQMLIQKEKI